MFPESTLPVSIFPEPHVSGVHVPSVYVPTSMVLESHVPPCLEQRLCQLLCSWHPMFSESPCSMCLCSLTLWSQCQLFLASMFPESHVPHIYVSSVLCSQGLMFPWLCYQILGSHGPIFPESCVLCYYVPRHLCFHVYVPRIIYSQSPLLLRSCFQSPMFLVSVTRSYVSSILCSLHLCFQSPKFPVFMFPVSYVPPSMLHESCCCLLLL